MPTLPDWLLWAGTATLTLLAAMLLVYAVFRGRPTSHRPRRCTRCHYSLSATPGLTCPECGYTGPSDRHLRRRPRRPWLALPALVLLAAAYAMSRLPTLQAHGWPAALPTWVLVLAAALDEAPPRGSRHERLITELKARIRNDRLWDVHWRLAFRICEFPVTTRTHWVSGNIILGSVRLPAWMAGFADFELNYASETVPAFQVIDRTMVDLMGQAARPFQPRPPAPLALANQTGRSTFLIDVRYGGGSPLTRLTRERTITASVRYTPAESVHDVLTPIDPRSPASWAGVLAAAPTPIARASIGPDPRSVLIRVFPDLVAASRQPTAFSGTLEVRHGGAVIASRRIRPMMVHETGELPITLNLSGDAAAVFLNPDKRAEITVRLLLGTADVLHLLDAEAFIVGEWEWRADDIFTPP